MIVILKINMFINSIYKTLNFQKSHASREKLQHYLEINMLGEISKHFKFMETQVRNHVNFQNELDFS